VKRYKYREGLATGVPHGALGIFNDSRLKHVSHDPEACSFSNKIR
jgi:hypothetical protein